MKKESEISKTDSKTNKTILEDMPGWCGSHCPKCGGTCRNDKDHSGDHLCMRGHEW